jgi:hypothetical protein
MPGDGGRKMERQDVAGQGRGQENMGLAVGWANSKIGQGVVFVYGEAGQSPWEIGSILPRLGSGGQFAALSSRTEISASIIALGASSNSDLSMQTREETPGG